MVKQYRSSVFAAIHETAEDILGAGLIGKAAMRDFDETCLTPVQAFSPDEIKTLREQTGASQPVFARYLNVTPGLVSQWERGKKHPSGPALKLLTLVKMNGLAAVA